MGKSMIDYPPDFGLVNIIAMVRIYLINNLISLDSVPNMLTIQLIRRSTSMKENLVALMIELKDHLKLILTLITLKLYI